MTIVPIQVQIRVPRQYAELAALPEIGETVILHADLHTRIPETLLATVFSSPPFGHVVMLCANPAKLRFRMEDWLAKSRIKVSKRCGGYVLGDCVLWILRADETDIPTSAINRLYVIDSHKIDHNPSIKADTVIYVGSLPHRGHWFCSLALASTNVMRFPVDTVMAAYPGVAEELEAARKVLESPAFKRTMNLEDVVETTTVASFARFARDRLFVRSDKKLEYLTQGQRESAATQEGTPIVPFHVGALQRLYMAKKRLALKQGKKPRYLLLKFRRGGFTTLEQGLNYKTSVTQPYSQVVTLAHKGPNTERIFGIAKIYLERDPKKPKADDSSHTIRFDNGSVFFIGTAGSDGFGRGETLQRVHGSEVSKWCLGPRQFDRVQDLISGLAGAASNGEVVLETTANGVEWFAATYKEAKKGLNDWTPIFLRWFDDPGNRHALNRFDPVEIQDTLTDEERDLAVRFRLDLAQISFRREMKREHKTLFPQEYPEDDINCFLTSGTAYFDIARLQDLIGKVRDGAPLKPVPGGYYVEWEPPIADERYVLGADTSEGVKGGDLSGYGIMHRDSGRQVAAIHGLFSPSLLAQHIVTGAQRYNQALAGVERNNHGHAVLQRIVELGYKDWNVLYHFSDERPGWNTDSTTRPIMLNGLADALLDRTDGWNDRDMLDECLTFKLQTNGHFEADPGAHDDTVIKWAIAEQMRKVRSRRASGFVV